VVWLKSSDTSASHPIVAAPLAWPLESLEGMDPQDFANLLYGIAHRCATHSAQHTTDYVITDGIVAMMAGPRWRVRAQQLARAGYWARAPDDTGWELLRDAEHLFHIRLRAEIEWEKIRKTDNANPALTVPVRLRDGDGCRYCGNIVQWTARRGNRAGTYDHRNPGQPARTREDLVVACGLCNRTRSNADSEAWPLRPVPTDPYYGPETIQFLAGYGHHVRPGDLPAREITPSDLASSETTRARPERATAGTSTDLQVSADSAGRGYPEVRNPGRVGSGSGRRRSRRGRGAGGSSEGR
jgi:hypothetical protein